MSQRYYGNTERPGILKYEFCQKNQQKGTGPGDSTAGVVYLSMKIHPNSCFISPLNVAATLLSVSRKGTVWA